MFTLDADEQRPLASPPVSVPAATLREITKLSSGEWVALLTGFSSLDLIHPYSLLLRSGRPLSISYQVSVYSLTDNSYASGWIRHREGKPLEAETTTRRNSNHRSATFMSQLYRNLQKKSVYRYIIEYDGNCDQSSEGYSTGLLKHCVQILITRTKSPDVSD
jgi:hypothetical protein